MRIWHYNPPIDYKTLEESGLPPLVAMAMGSRGFEPAEACNFLYQDASWPALQIPEMITAAKLVADHEGSILIAGDYDADGICATVILKLFLEELTDREVYTYLPNREVGYGFNAEALEKAHEVGAGLVVTVDCGVNNQATVAKGREMGLKLIITDHHEPMEGRPDADAVVDLKLNSGLYDFDQLCGAALAYKLVEAICVTTGYVSKQEGYYRILASIATVADIVPLVGENRTLVKRGLAEAFPQGYPGLAKLCKAAKIDKLTDVDIAFKIGPRLNAASRVGDPGTSLKLLLATSNTEAQAFAEELEELNNKRRLLVDEAYQLVKESLEGADVSKLLLAQVDILPGIAGPLANRLVDEYQVPALIISAQGFGSARAPEGYNLLELLALAGDLFDSYGGHKGACGFSLNPDSIDELYKQLIEAAPPVPRTTYQYVDGVIDNRYCTLEHVKSLNLLGPFGQGNPEPVFLIRNVEPRNVYPMGKSREHVSFDVGGLRCVWFNYNPNLLEEGQVDLAVHLQLNTFKRRTTPQAMVVNIEPSVLVDRKALVYAYATLVKAGGVSAFNDGADLMSDVITTIFEELKFIERTEKGIVPLDLKTRRELEDSVTYKLYAS
ncbi:MAG: DHH family phosphoesterase [Desulfotomaculaceae bacterium]|nr:DHH family phosphoesterase [Desulfotomaculaceae bacterium]